MHHTPVAPASRAARTTSARPAGSSVSPGRDRRHRHAGVDPGVDQHAQGRSRWRGGAVPGSVRRQISRIEGRDRQAHADVGPPGGGLQHVDVRTTIGPRVTMLKGEARRRAITVRHWRVMR